MAPPKSVWSELIALISRPGLWKRIGVCFAATTVMFFVSRAWQPAFQYRIGQIPAREMAAKVPFAVIDNEATQEARERARSKVLCLYEHDPLPLVELRQALVDSLFAVLQKPSEETLETIWPQFFSDSKSPDGTEPEVDQSIVPSVESIELLKQSVAKDETLEAVKAALNKAFLEFDRTGLIDTLGHDLGQGNMREIKVFSKGNPDDTIDVEVAKVRIPEVSQLISDNIRKEFTNESAALSNPDWLADRVFHWLKPRLPVTLKWNQAATLVAARAAASNVAPVDRIYAVGEPLQKEALLSDQKSVVGGGTPLGLADLELLRAEYQSILATTPISTEVIRSFFFFALGLTCFLLASSYMRQRQPALIDDLTQYSVLVIAFAATFVAMWGMAYFVEYRLEIIPLVLFAMSIAIAYHVGLAIMLSSLVILLFSVAHGYDIGEFVVLSVAASVASLYCKTIRSRTKSVYIGLIAAAAVFPVSLAIQFVATLQIRPELILNALWFAGGAAVAGLIMTALLPFLERWFGLQTDISLLELSDPNHPLLRQLVQRAPGTYNHSITVASIAEAAADAIGANGLLCRVGAYFHDIGKMRKPEYFVENQVGGENKHDDLVPTMSTIVIISHVKDGAEMARKYHLPRPIIDLIEQHHGTTLVEYFFHRASQHATEDSAVEEASFRYPGPRPQTPEAAVLMLADAVEGACRTLREPAPSRIESLVDDITKKKLDDGQFDDCAITLKQIKIIQDSLVKSLNAMYHARVKYPDQQTA